MSDERDDPSVSEGVLEQFHTVSVSSGSADLDALLQKGLYGSRLPKELKGKKAADAFQQAFDLIGGVPRLALWADKNPTQFFALYSKLIPSSVKAEVNATIKIDAPWMNPNRLNYQSPPADVVDVTPSKPKELE